MSATSSRLQVAALLVVTLLIAAGYELADPFMPRYISKKALEANILLVGLYGSLEDIMEAIYYRFGGRLGGRLGARKSFVLFTMMPVAGALLVLGWHSNLAPIAALPLLSAWDAIAGPMTLTVIGAKVSVQKRTFGFSLQSIQRRVPRIAAYLCGGYFMSRWGVEHGVHVSLAIFICLALVALLVVLRFLHVEEKDTSPHPSRFFQSLREMHRDLKLLLISDIFARLAEGFPRVFIVLYLTQWLGEKGIGEATFGQFMAFNSFVSLLTYIPIGLLASKEGAGKKPYIGLTFVFFALFPISIVLGAKAGTAGLIAAFFVMGLREFGEPARKAMITELMPKDRRTELTGIYWSARSWCVMLAPFLGALAWKFIGPVAPFAIATALGVFGAALFYLRFAKAATPTPTPAG